MTGHLPAEVGECKVQPIEDPTTIIVSFRCCLTGIDFDLLSLIHSQQSNHSDAPGSLRLEVACPSQDLDHLRLSHSYQ